MGGPPPVQKEDKPSKEEIEHEYGEKLERRWVNKDDKAREMRIKWDALKTCLAYPDLFKPRFMDDGKGGTIKVYNEGLMLAITYFEEIRVYVENGSPEALRLKDDIDIYLKEKLSSNPTEANEGDRFFCLAIFAADRSSEVRKLDAKKEFMELITKWAEYRFGPPPRKLRLVIEPKETSYYHLSDTRPEILQLDRIYADEMLGKEKREYLEMEGIHRFLRYPLFVLEDTYGFLSGELPADWSAGLDVALYLGAARDNNGTLYADHTDLREISPFYMQKQGCTYQIITIALEAGDRDELLEKLGRFVYQLDTYEQERWRGKHDLNIILNSFLLAAHGDPLGVILGSGTDEKDLLHVGNIETFRRMVEILGKRRFKSAFVLSCLSAKEEFMNWFITISDRMKVIADKVYGLPEKGVPEVHFMPKLNPEQPDRWFVPLYVDKIGDSWKKIKPMKKM